MTKLFFIIQLTYFTVVTAFSQKIESELGVGKLNIGQDISTIENLSLAEDKFKIIKNIFLPVKISYLAKDVKIRSQLFEVDSIYFNINTQNKVNAIIFNIPDSHSLENMLVAKLGEPLNTLTFRAGASGTSLKGWKINDEFIIILRIGNFPIVIIYDGNKSSFFDLPHGILIDSAK